MDLDIGSRMRKVREMHGLSQRALAKRTGVSNATISLIEQNRSSPSVGLLKKILDGVPMALSEFFSLAATPQRRVFFEPDELVELAGDPVSYRQVGVDLSERQIQILHERYAPGADTGQSMLQHEGEEGAVVLRGRLEVTVGDQRRILGPGSAYYFDSRLPHRFRNPGDEVCELVSACTPPSF